MRRGGAKDTEKRKGWGREMKGEETVGGSFTGPTFASLASIPVAGGLRQLQPAGRDGSGGLPRGQCESHTFAQSSSVQDIL